MRKLTLSAKQQESRAKNAAAELLIRNLIVPKIFFDAAWPNRNGRIDVLAVDRSGSGDVHVVEIKVGANLKSLASAVDPLMDIPAHFKYVALFENRTYRPDIRSLYSDDGMGRIGVIQIRENSAGDLSADYLVRPERFLLDSSIFKSVDRFTAAHQPNFEIRP